MGPDQGINFVEVTVVLAIATGVFWWIFYWKQTKAKAKAAIMKKLWCDKGKHDYAPYPLPKSGDESPLGELVSGLADRHTPRHHSCTYCGDIALTPWPELVRIDHPGQVGSWETAVAHPMDNLAEEVAADVRRLRAL